MKSLCTESEDPMADAPIDNPSNQADSTHHYQMAKPVDTPPQRVVSLVPSMTESLFDLGLGDRVVGLTDYCVRPAEAFERLPHVGGTKNPNIEQIIALKPDLVMMNDEENRKEDADALQSASIPIWVTGPRTVLEAINILWEIMEIFDHADRVPTVRLMEQKYDVISLAMENERQIKTFVPIWKDPWMTANRDTYMHDMLTVLGMENIFADRKRKFPLAADKGMDKPLPENDPRVEGRDVRYPRVTLEEIEAAQPELVLLPDEPYIFEESDADVFLEMDTPAARQGNVYLIEGALLMWHGTRLAQALYQLPTMLTDIRERLTGEDS
jgi:ABC-type Fe3+-hydroxamate transport system substrate-binding protein